MILVFFCKNAKALSPAVGNTRPESLNMLDAPQPIRTLQAFLLLALLLAGTGCQNWPQSQRMMQQQIESERLLSEYRAQKKRADELESKNRQLSDRLSESEKMLARLQSEPSSNNRLASRESSQTMRLSDQPTGTVSDYASDFRSQMSERNARPTKPTSPNNSKPVWQSLSRP